MAKTAAAGFDTYLSWITPTAAERAVAASHRASLEGKLKASFDVWRMFESGSFKHGTGISGVSDVDYFLSLKGGRPANSVSILTAVRSKLMERFPTTTVRVSRPGVVVEFGSGYETCEIIPAYPMTKVGDGMKYSIPGVRTEWLESTPEAHLDYVTLSNTKPIKGAAKAMARLAKGWKYSRGVPISSFYLEMRAAAYIRKQKTVIYSIDLYYFLSELQTLGLADMNDPTGSTGRIAACSSEANRLDAVTKLNRAVGRAKKGMDLDLAGKTEEAFEQWDLLFNGSFPTYG